MAAFDLVRVLEATDEEVDMSEGGSIVMQFRISVRNKVEALES
jgi:hypothetical protein